MKQRIGLITAVLLWPEATWAAEADDQALLEVEAPDRGLNPYDAPYTVFPGQFQLELDAANVALDEGSQTIGLGTVRLKTGVTDFMDVQLAYDAFLAVDGEIGVGDLAFRANFNVWGNDEGDSAFSLMPYVLIPTGTEGLGATGFQGGLIPVYWLNLPYGFSINVVPQLDFIRGEDGGYSTEFCGVATFNATVLEILYPYIKASATTAFDGETPGYTFDFGLGAQLGDDFLLQTGANVGLNDTAEDLAFYFGAAARL